MNNMPGKENSISPTSSINSTFMVKVVYAENFSIQGYIKWIEEGRTVPFRSYMELLHLVDEGMLISRKEITRLRSWELSIEEGEGGNDKRGVL